MQRELDTLEERVLELISLNESLRKVNKDLVSQLDKKFDECEVLKKKVLEECGTELYINKEAGIVDHAFSHFTISLNSYFCSEKKNPIKQSSKRKWIYKKNIKDYTFPKANHKLFRQLEIKNWDKLFHENFRVDEMKTQIKLMHLDDFFALSGAAELIYKGWDKEAIPFIKVKKSIISRFFERFFKN